MRVFHFGGIQDGEAFFGHVELRDGATRFVRSLFVESLEIANMVIVLDELNRAPAHVLNALLSVLDHQRRLVLDLEEPGRRIVELAPGVTILATANHGAEHTGIEPLDAALSDRFGAARLGFALEEAELLVAVTGVAKGDAAKIAKVAREIRAQFARGRAARDDLDAPPARRRRAGVRGRSLDRSGLRPQLPRLRRRGRHRAPHHRARRARREGGMNANHRDWVAKTLARRGPPGRPFAAGLVPPECSDPERALQAAAVAALSAIAARRVSVGFEAGMSYADVENGVANLALDVAQSGDASWLAERVIGLGAHEGAHLRLSRARPAGESPLFAWLHNLIEDERIECALARYYPVLAFPLAQLRRDVGPGGFLPSPSGASTAIRNWP